MRAEEIAIHCLIFIANIAVYALLFQVWKYLNSKPLGLQTVLDDLAKDGMVLLAMVLTYNWTTWIKFSSEYNYYVALIIVNTGVMFRVSLILQALTFSITRYLFVFNFSHINNVAESSIKMVSRIFVAVVSISCAFFDDWTGGKKFLYLTENQIDKKLVPKNPKTLFTIIVAISSLLIIVYVQSRIAYAKWKYPEIYNNNEDGETFNLRIISVVTAILIVAVIIVISHIFARNALWKSLLTLLCTRIIVLVMILLLVYSNQHLFNFVKNCLRSFQGNPHPSTPQNDPTPNNVSIENPFIIPQPIQLFQQALSNTDPLENPHVIPELTPRPTEENEIQSVSYPLHSIYRNRSLHQIDSLPNVWI